MDTQAHRKLVALLIDARKKADIGQVELAKRLGVSQTSIFRLEAGQRQIDVIEYLRLAKALRFDPIAMLAEVLKARGI